MRIRPFSVCPPVVYCWIFLLITLLSAGKHSVRADEQPLRADDDEKTRRSTAVALNYCRSALHRIKRNPSKRVLVEERDRILNNLNLKDIADEEVIRLYTTVLDEIGQIEIADKEREFIQQKHRRVLVEKLAVQTLGLGTQIATGQMVEAARTGVSSWWDFRTMIWNRDLDTWRIEKERMEAVLGKSSVFLDTFWKLAHKRDIPDRWLVREHDLDELADAMEIEDLDARLRVLNRMEVFLEAFPPYLYYVARTQQQLGQLFAAAKTYQRLEQMGGGHFRRDEMLAAGVANQAVIQEYLGQSTAPVTARRALTYSTDVWQANLMCAAVLVRHRDYAPAEDAVLRNIDVDLEQPHSTAALAGVYCAAEDKRRLVKLLENPERVAFVPPPLLLQCAQILEAENFPAAAASRLEATLLGDIDYKLGRDDFVLTATHDWQLNNAHVSISVNGNNFSPAQSESRDGRLHFRFPQVGEWGLPLGARLHPEPALVNISYPDGPAVRLHLHAPGPLVSNPLRRAVLAENSGFRITAIEMPGTHLSLLPK